METLRNMAGGVGFALSAYGLLWAFEILEVIAR